MLRLYRTNLEVRLRSIDESTLETDAQKRTYAAASEMLSACAPSEKNTDWDEAYRAERMILLLLGGEQLRQEISARLDEMPDNAPEALRMRAQYDAMVKPPVGTPAVPIDDGVLRSFLLRIMETLHWQAKKRYLARPIRQEATKNILWCMLVAFVLMITPYILQNLDAVGIGLNKWWSVFALYTAVVSGLLGAFFSRLISVQKGWASMTLDEVFLHREFSYTLLRAGVGMCGAVIIYFFFKSGLVDGALFPKFDKLAMEWVGPPGGSMAFVVPSKDLALMTVWCFLAGFSEILVPNLLASTERQFSENTAPGKSAAR